MSASPTYFALLGLAPQFDIDPQALESAYFTQQRQYHPDRFAAKSASERQQALHTSADINKAYETLKNPLKRAQYLLHLQGITVGTEADSIKPTPSLLMETMQWRENIDQAQAAALEKLSGGLNALFAGSLETISKACCDKAWDDMAHETLRLGYLIKAQEAIAQKKKRIEKQAS